MACWAADSAFGAAILFALPRDDACLIAAEVARRELAHWPG